MENIDFKDQNAISDKLFNFYKEQYFFEIQRRQHHYNSLSIPIAFMTAIFTVYAYYFNKFLVFNCYATIKIVFLIITSISILSLSKACFHFYKAFTGREYGYVPNPTLINSFEKELKKTNTQIYAETLCMEHIKTSFIKTAGHNKEQNHIRSTQLHHCNQYVIFSLILTIIAAIPFFYVQQLN